MAVALEPNTAIGDVGYDGDDSGGRNREKAFLDIFIVDIIAENNVPGAIFALAGKQMAKVKIDMLHGVALHQVPKGMSAMKRKVAAP